MSTRFFANPLSRSLGIHILLLLLAFFYITQLSKPFPPAPPMEVTFVEKVDEAKEKAAEKKKLEDDKNLRFVRKSEGTQVEVAKKNSYLSDKTRVTDEERSARNAGEAVVAGKMSAPQPVQVPSAQAPKSVTLSDLGVKLAPQPVQKPYEQERKWANANMGEAVRGGEYIQGMKEGEVSALNTKESIFYSYFERVRRQLDQAWQPILRENIAHIFKTGRRLASNTEFVTRTLVTLNREGEIVKVQLLDESGTRDVDQAAVDALNKAGPYPNPPKGLIDAQGLVQIRWDFILKT